MPMFDVSFTAKWEGNSILGATRTSTGTIAVNDVLPEDVYKLTTKQRTETSEIPERDLQWLNFPVSVIQDASTRGLEVDQASLVCANTLLVVSVQNAVRSLSKLLFSVADGEVKAEALVDQANEIQLLYKRDLSKNEEVRRTQAQLALSKRAAALEAETKKSIAKAKADRAEEENKRVASTLASSTSSTDLGKVSGSFGQSSIQ